MPCASAQQRLQSLLDLMHLVMRADDPDEVLTTILTAARRLFEAEGCSLALIDPTTHELAFVTMVGPAQVDAFRLPLGQGIAGWVAQTGHGVVCNDVTQDARFFRGVDQQTGYTTRSLLCAPLQQYDSLLGVIEVLNTTRPAGFDTEDLALLTAFGGVASTALTRSQTFARVCNVGAAFAEVVHARYHLVPGTSAAMQEPLRLARTVAATPTTVLLLGESGTGKEVLARAIHQWSPRAAHPFVAVNCVTLTPELLASDLFGHEKGAFTGAIAQKKGKFELAHGGTLFLDEIGDLAPDLQAKLLRVLQDKEVQRVGGTKDLPVDVRLIAATNRDLHQAMQRGVFREDLYYRLNVVSLTLPPLRDRPEDIPPLVQHFLAYYSREVNRPGLTITPAALDLLQAYPWPGNVRELQNAIERAVVVAPSPVLTGADFPPAISQSSRPPAGAGLPSLRHDDRMRRDADVSGQRAWGAADSLPPGAAQIQQALLQTGGNVARAARLLGVSRDTVRYRMQQYGLARPCLEAVSLPGAAALQQAP
jgi:Nif-specific regulatory protein